MRTKLAELAVTFGSVLFAQAPDGQTAPATGSQPPALVSAPPPEFSQEARDRKLGGTVLVKVDVGKDGVPDHVRVVRGIGYGLDEKAVEAVRRYKFTPAKKDGKPVKVTISIAVNFQVVDRP